MSKQIEEKNVDVITDVNGVVIKRKHFPENPDIVHYYEKDVVKKIGEGEDDFVVEKKVVEYERLNRQDFIDSHVNDVGVKNMISKAIQNGESADYVLTEKFKSPQKGFVDMIEVESAVSDPDMFAKKVKAAADKLPKGLTKGKTARDIAKMSDTEIEAFIDGLIEKKIASMPHKGESVDLLAKKEEVK